MLASISDSSKGTCHFISIYHHSLDLYDKAENSAYDYASSDNNPSSDARINKNEFDDIDDIDDLLINLLRNNSI